MEKIKIEDLIEKVSKGKNFYKDHPFETNEAIIYTAEEYPGFSTKSYISLYAELKTPRKMKEKLYVQGIGTEFDPDCKCKPCKIKQEEAIERAMKDCFSNHSLKVFHKTILPKSQEVVNNLGMYLCSAGGSEYHIRKETDKCDLGIGTITPKKFDISFRFEECKELAVKLFDIYLNTHRKCCEW